jgi:N-acetylglucosaminyl-diphospho-decaprenol L-rhamnosyltransferase
MTMSPLSSHANSQMAGPEIGVVIVNYCTAAMTIDCLASLAERRSECTSMVVGVADNASPDGSGEMIARAIVENGWSDWARLVPLPRNGGFGYGNNAIIREYLNGPAKPKYIWLLNSDTVVRPGAVTSLLDFMERYPRVGVAGSRLEDPDGTPQHSAFQFPSIIAEFEASIRLGPVTRLLRRWMVAPPIVDQNTPFTWLSGAAMFFRPEVFLQAGLFDETYFLYYEEADLCLRVAEKGWELWYVPASHVVHLVGQSTGVTERTARPRRLPRYWFESRRYFYTKHRGRLYAALVDLALAAGSGLAIARSAIQRRPSLCPPHLFSDLARHGAILNSSQVRTQQ